ncbi:hypothetical protein SBADM41S_04649 [Streptomyces badius]
MVRLMTPKTGRDGYVEPSDINEAAQTAGLGQTKSISAGKDWTGSRLATPEGGQSQALNRFSHHPEALTGASAPVRAFVRPPPGCVGWETPGRARPGPRASGEAAKGCVRPARHRSRLRRQRFIMPRRT